MKNEIKEVDDDDSKKNKFPQKIASFANGIYRDCERERKTLGR